MLQQKQNNEKTLPKNDYSGVLSYFVNEVNRTNFGMFEEEDDAYNTPLLLTDDELLPSEDSSNMQYFFAVDEESNNDERSSLNGGFRCNEDLRAATEQNLPFQYLRSDSLDSSNLTEEEISIDLREMIDVDGEDSLPNNLRTLLSGEFENFNDRTMSNVLATANISSNVMPVESTTNRKRAHQDEPSAVGVLIKRMFQSIDKV